MQILAFDYGTKHIGVAVGQTITRTSSPLTILNVQQEGPDIWRTIVQLVEEWKPDRLLVGQPLNMDGTPSEMMKKVNNFYIRCFLITFFLLYEIFYLYLYNVNF